MLNLMQRNTAPGASRILRPGIRALPVNVERYPVKGGGSVLADVHAGDQITVTDIEGGQPCEIVFCDAAGRFDPAGLGGIGDGTADGLKAMLARNTEGAARVLAGLRRRNIDLAAARSFGLFGRSSPAG